MRRESFLAVVLACCCGCQATWVEKRANRLNASVPELYYDQVLDNVALAFARPDSLPYFGLPAQGTTTNTRQFQAGYTPMWDFLTTGTSVIRHWFFDHQSAAFTGSNLDSQAFQITPLTDPDKLVLLGEVFHLVAGNYLPLAGTDPLTTYYCFHQKNPDCPKVDCTNYQCLCETITPYSPDNCAPKETLPAPPVDPSTSTSQNRNTSLAAVKQYSQPVDDVAPSVADPTASVPEQYGCHQCDSWTYCNYQLLFDRVLKQGWVNVTHRKRDMPKHACYVGHYCDIYVWVDETNRLQLRDLTLVVLDITSADLNGLNNQGTHTPGKTKAMHDQANDYRRQSKDLKKQAYKATKERSRTLESTPGIGPLVAQNTENYIRSLNSHAAILDSQAAELDAQAELIEAQSGRPGRAPRLGPGFPFPSPPTPPSISP